MKLTRGITLIILMFTVALLVACDGGESEITEPPAIEPIAVDESASGDVINLGAGENAAQSFTILPEQSQASYIVNEEFFSEALDKLGIEAGEQVIVGTTSGVSGNMTLNFGNAALVEAGQFTVDMKGLQTDQNRRDNWLRENAIQSDLFPESTFVITSVSGLPESYTTGEEIGFQMNGDLTVRDVTVPVTFEVTAMLSGDILQGTAVLPINLTDFNITPPSFVDTLTVADPFRIEVQFAAQSG